jgi:hypothetical protein
MAIASYVEGLDARRAVSIRMSERSRSTARNRHYAAKFRLA